MNPPIPTYVINLKTRTDRREHILSQFAGRTEFDVAIIDAQTHEYGCVGLWNTIRQIVWESIEYQHEYILICEDDHLFTDAYSKELLQETISQAVGLGADVLSGGVSWHEDAVEISDTLFWVKRFSGTQFIILFKKFFQAIVDANFTPMDTADSKMAASSDRIYFMEPFVSVQKEFGYSDATTRNNGTDRVEDLFTHSATSARIKRNIRSFYSLPSGTAADADNDTIGDESVPVYIINMPERTDRREHILQQFEGKPEFDITVVDACRHKVGAFGLWQSVRKVVQLAIDNDDDVMIICEDDHEFTPHYSRESLFKNIFLAYQHGCDYMSGGSGRVDLPVPIAENLFWTSHCLSAQFIIVFRKFFQPILDAEFDETVIGDIHLSKLTGNKMVIFPFISLQKDFGYSDVTPLHNMQEGIVQLMFGMAAARLDKMHEAFNGHRNREPEILSKTLSF